MTNNNKFTISAPTSIQGEWQSPSAGEWWFDTSGGFTVTSDNSINQYQRRLDNIEKTLEEIKNRLAILDNPGPDILEKHKMLRDAYKKYKMIEALIGEAP